ncbi:MAG: DUF885 domain-containing protein [Gammaproteobacteria bacterium]|nr:DUF885 domain-containing protein [Gammaproteobacteria bacterium]
MRLHLRSLVITLLLLATPLVAQPSSDHQRLQDLFDREWQFRLAEFPMLASYTEAPGAYDKLGSVAEPDQLRRAEFWRGILAELAQIDIASLEREDQINYRLFQRQLGLMIENIEFHDYQIPILVDEGFHTEFARMPEYVRMRNVSDYENYISRMRAWPALVKQQITNMRAGLERGFSQPQVILQGFDKMLLPLLVQDPRDSGFWAPFDSFPAGISQADQERLKVQGADAIMTGVVAGYTEFLRFMQEEYIPGTRTSLGAYDMPDGEAYYALKIRQYTTLDLSAEEIHQIGLSEVARIRAEMDEIIRQLDFQGSFAEFLAFLRSDPQFYASTPEELLKDAAWIAKSMDGKLPSLFKILPRQPYTVNPVPDNIAPKYTAGRYVGAPIDSTRPGQYWVNTYDLKSRPLYALPALTLHEAVPGHHLQGALAEEHSEQPNFRRLDYISAYGEGWGLYSEFLGIEAGMYPDPYSNFGRLTYEMWRACRLVVDTGLHTKGWTRQQALDYLGQNTALSLHEVTTEIDRYISWPGQALAYKLGELKIKALRKQAEEQLGAEFDLREFHDEILRSGSVSLDILDTLIQEYIQRELSPKPDGASSPPVAANSAHQ